MQEFFSLENGFIPIFYSNRLPPVRTKRWGAPLSSRSTGIVWGTLVRMHQDPPSFVSRFFLTEWV